MTPHIEASIGSIAKNVIMPGDPLRAKYIASKFLSDVKEINHVRLNMGYTGTYKGTEVTILSSGMGMPSLSIYVTELIKEYHVNKIIRVGSCGAYQKSIKPRTIIIPKEAYTDSNIAFCHSGIQKNIATPDKTLFERIIKQSQGNDHIITGTIKTSDLFYRDIPDIDNNYLAVEMETFALFYLAEKYQIKAAAILTVSDNLITKEALTSEEREKTFDEAILIALSSLKED